MYPILFNLFGINIYASPVFLTLAIIVGIYVGRREADRRGVRRSDFTIYCVTIIPIALLFGVLNGMFFYGGPKFLLEALSDPQELLSNGLVSFGVVIVMFAWGFILAKIRKQPIAPTLESIALMLPLILGIYRIGCILNGCCYGEETTSALGLYLPNAYGEWAERYPTQIMFMLFDFALFAFLWDRRLKKTSPGSAVVIFLLSFSTFRLVVDGLRELPKALVGFNLHQLASISILLVTLYFMYEYSLEKSGSKVV